LTQTPRKRRRPRVEGDPVVGGEPSVNGARSEPGDLGQAIEWVRRALSPFDGEMRKRIVRAANQLMK
jgi:hypothetical protein